MKPHVFLICLLGNPYQLIEGGYNRTIHEIIEYFKNTDVQFTVVTSNSNIKKDKKQMLYSNITLHEIYINQKWIDNQDELYYHKESILQKLQEIFSTVENTITIIHSTQWFNGFLAAQLNKNCHLTHIHSIISSSYERQLHGFPLRSKYQRDCEDITFKNADLLIAISVMEQQQLVQQYHVKPSKIIVVGRDVESSFYENVEERKTNISNDKKVLFNATGHNDENWWCNNAFCYVGRIISYKGIKEIISAWLILYKEYDKHTPPLWIIGGSASTISAFRNELKQDIPDLPYYEAIYKIVWWGYLNQEVISGILLKVNVLIMHSAFEPGGRVMLEAMSAEKPVIATKTGFAGTYIENWYNGYSVDYKDINKLAKYMEFFVKNEYLSNMLGINALRTYTQLKQSWDYYGRLSEIYHRDYKSCDFSNQPYKLIHEYPLLIDVFPYLDIKNEDEYLYHFFHIDKNSLVIHNEYHSYIWDAYYDRESIIIKQFYNRLNINQLWNKNDSRKVISIWMLYHTSLLSSEYNMIVKPIQKEDKLFSYMLPRCSLIDDDYIMNVLFSTIKDFHLQESGLYHINSERSITREYFQNVNKNLQKQHKHYTKELLFYDLKQIFGEHIFYFTEEEQSNISNIFVQMEYHLKRTEIQYGLNYGKSFLNHTVNYKDDIYFLPTADAFIGEVGYDEGETLVEYYKKYGFISSGLNEEKDLKNGYFLWGALLLCERYLQEQILDQTPSVSINDIQNFLNEIL